MNSYSIEQNDVRMLKYLRDIKEGIFIECGANDGISQSNTKLYEEYLGWSGLLVEPNKIKFQECRENRPLSIVENYALVASSYKKKHVEGFFQFRDYGKSMCGRITTSDNLAHDPLDERFLGAESIKVPCIALEKLLVKHGFVSRPIHFFSLDVEGYELNVLKGLDLTIIRPWYVHVEAPGTRKGVEELGHYLNSHNYEFIEQITNNDRLYAAKEVCAAIHP